MGQVVLCAINEGYPRGLGPIGGLYADPIGISLRTRTLLRAGLAALVIAAFPAGAQDFSALARMDVAQSGAVDRMRSVDVNVLLSQPVPYRVFTLDDPCRLVLNFSRG